MSAVAATSSKATTTKVKKVEQQQTEQVAPRRGEGIELVRDAQHFVSEPNPAWFGNKPNPSKEHIDPVQDEGAGHGKANDEWTNWSNWNWLKSRFHFNFAEYRTGSTNFGPLRVCNDDLVQPHRGFGEHPHQNAEIVTYVVDGALTHQDSMGTAETLTTGDIQFMTAGRGVRHSEHNLSDKPLRFIQMWFVTRQSGLKPNYGSMRGDPKKRRNQWQHLVTDVRNQDEDSVPIRINQDVNLFVTDMTANQALPYRVKSDRQIYLLCLNGQSVMLQPGVFVSQHDAAKIQGGTDLFVQTKASGASILIIDVPRRWKP